MSDDKKSISPSGHLQEIKDTAELLAEFGTAINGLGGNEAGFVIENLTNLKLQLRAAIDTSNAGVKSVPYISPASGKFYKLNNIGDEADIPPKDSKGQSAPSGELADIKSGGAGAIGLLVYQHPDLPLYFIFYCAAFTNSNLQGAYASIVFAPEWKDRLSGPDVGIWAADILSVFNNMVSDSKLQQKRGYAMAGGYYIQWSWQAAEGNEDDTEAFFQIGNGPPPDLKEPNQVGQTYLLQNVKTGRYIRAKNLDDPGLFIEFTEDSVVSSTYAPRGSQDLPNIGNTTQPMATTLRWDKPTEGQGAYLMFQDSKESEGPGGSIWRNTFIAGNAIAAPYTEGGANELLLNPYSLPDAKTFIAPYISPYQSHGVPQSRWRQVPVESENAYLIEAGTDGTFLVARPTGEIELDEIKGNPTKPGAEYLWHIRTVENAARNPNPD